MRARDQSSIFSTGGKFHPDYGLLLELHALTLVTALDTSYGRGPICWGSCLPSTVHSQNTHNTIWQHTWTHTVQLVYISLCILLVHVFGEHEITTGHWSMVHNSPSSLPLDCSSCVHKQCAQCSVLSTCRPLVDGFALYLVNYKSTIWTTS